MDPLSISSGIVGFLGFSGQISNIISKIITAKKDEKKALDQVVTQAEYFSRILSDLQGHIGELTSVNMPGNQAVDYAPLEECLTMCNEKLQEFVDKLKPPITKWKGLLHQIKWPLKDGEVKKLIELVNQCKTSIQLELTIKQGRILHTSTQDIQRTLATQDTVVATKAATLALQSDITYRSVFEWLDVVEVNSNLDRARQKCHSGTGRWFLDSPEFESFKSNHNQFLWLHGKPGTGKTILCGSIIAVLRDEVKSDDQAALAYFFFSYQEPKKKIAFNMLSSIAAQLLQPLLSIPSRIVELYRRNRSRPPSDVVLEIIDCLSQCFQRAYIVLDALDEVEVSERDNLLTLLNTLVATSRATGSNINVLITSRRESYLVDGLKPLLVEMISLESNLVKPDINLYVTDIVRQLSKWSTELQAEIVQTLSAKSGGMFRWVECQIAALKKCRREYDVKRVLSTLPKTLDETYRRILISVEEDDRIYLARLLAWVIFYPETLSLDLLAEAITFDPNTCELKPQCRFSSSEEILDLCENLFTSFSKGKMWYPASRLHHLDTRLQLHMALSHYSVQEYICSERFMSDPELVVYTTILKCGKEFPLTVVMKYWATAALSYSGLGHEFICKCVEKDYPLLLVALETVLGNIAESKSFPERQQMEEWLANMLCDNFPLIRHLLKYDPQSWQCPLSFVAKRGLLHSSKICLEHGCDVNVNASLKCALQSPNTISVMRFLIQNGARDVVETQQGPHSPALYAELHPTSFGEWMPRQEIVQLLLEHGGASLNSPYYPRGICLPVPYPKALDILFISPFGLRDWVPQLLKEHGAQLDPVFPRLADGMVDSFIGETVEFFAQSNDLQGIKIALEQGAKIGRPVRDANAVTTLLKRDMQQGKSCKEMFLGWNAFCASKGILEGCGSIMGGMMWNKEEWINRILFLLENEANINALDCVVGSGHDGEIYHLEYCTAREFMMTLGNYLQELEVASQNKKKAWIQKKRQKLGLEEKDISIRMLKSFGLEKERVLASELCFRVSSLLTSYGALVLPREPATKRIWRIKEKNYYSSWQ